MNLQFLTKEIIRPRLNSKNLELLESVKANESSKKLNFIAQYFQND